MFREPFLAIGGRGKKPSLYKALSKGRNIFIRSSKAGAFESTLKLPPLFPHPIRRESGFGLKRRRKPRPQRRGKYVNVIFLLATTKAAGSMRRQKKRGKKKKGHEMAALLQSDIKLASLFSHEKDGMLSAFLK